MKGKKIDTEFISLFITKSAEQGINTPALIADKAKKMLLKIDRQIKRAEDKKAIRSKLIDVINLFDNNIKNNTDTDAKIISFFEIKNPNICKDICNRLKIKQLNVKDLDRGTDILFTIKQLIKYNIIIRNDNLISKGVRFDEYIAFCDRK